MACHYENRIMAMVKIAQSYPDRIKNLIYVVCTIKTHT